MSDISKLSEVVKKADIDQTFEKILAMYRHVLFYVIFDRFSGTKTRQRLAQVVVVIFMSYTEK